jgi:hypothetical protein
MRKFVKEPPKKNFVFQFLTHRPVLMIMSIIWTLMVARLSVLILLVIIITVYATISIHKKEKLLNILWVILFLLPILPLDITFTNVPGPPRFVPFVNGLAGYETREKAKKGEVVLGSCLVTGFEPKWVLVW